MERAQHSQTVGIRKESGDLKSPRPYHKLASLPPWIKPDRFVGMHLKKDNRGGRPLHARGGSAPLTRKLSLDSLIFHGTRPIHHSSTRIKSTPLSTLSKSYFLLRVSRCTDNEQFAARIEF